LCGAKSLKKTLKNDEKRLTYPYDYGIISRLSPKDGKRQPLLTGVV
jgi:hypothetical protein